jgi:hypothetical protein
VRSKTADLHPEQEIHRDMPWSHSAAVSVLPLPLCLIFLFIIVDDSGPSSTLGAARCRRWSSSNRAVAGMSGRISPPIRPRTVSTNKIVCQRCAEFTLATRATGQNHRLTVGRLAISECSGCAASVRSFARLFDSQFPERRATDCQSLIICSFPVVFAQFACQMCAR